MAKKRIAQEECFFCEKHPCVCTSAKRPMVTKTGKVLTDADIEALADEAERGYDVSHLRAAGEKREPR